MKSIRTRLILFISLLIILVDTLCCLLFFTLSKKQHEDALKEFGISFATLLAHDSEVKFAINQGQEVLLHTSIKRILTADRDRVVGYWRISNRKNVILEEISPWANIKIEEIPIRNDFYNPEKPVINRIVSSSKGIFLDFFVPISERQVFSGEVFAAWIFDDVPSKTEQRISGFIQIGLSTHKIRERVQSVIWKSIIPMGLIIIFAGTVLTYFITRHLTSPLQRLTLVTLDIARGNLSGKVNIRSRDEIGQLAVNFNRMIETLEKSYAKLTQEIAEHKQTEETLRVSESKYRTLLENLPQKIFLKDRNSTYISCNKNYAMDFKIEPDDIFGKTDYDFFPKELADKYRADDRRIIESGKIEELEEKYMKDGKELFIHTIKTPVRDEKGNIVAILGIFWDITEKTILQMEAIRSRNLASLGELAASVAHEVNNPINGIINYAQLLVDGTEDRNTEKDIAKQIIKEGCRIANIVKSLLSFAYKGNEENTFIDVHKILSDALTLTATQIRKDGIYLRVDIQEGLPQIFANYQKVEQVFLNIISNSRHALNQKYHEAHVNKSLEISGEKVIIDGRTYVRIKFHDHGTGIPAEIRDKITEPFFTTKPRGKGTGMGLSISYGIVSDLGGKITFDSVEGKYTTMIVDLPAVTTQSG